MTPAFFFRHKIRRYYRLRFICGTALFLMIMIAYFGCKKIVENIRFFQHLVESVLKIVSAR